MEFIRLYEDDLFGFISGKVIIENNNDELVHKIIRSIFGNYDNTKSYRYYKVRAYIGNDQMPENLLFGFDHANGYAGFEKHKLVQASELLKSGSGDKYLLSPPSQDEEIERHYEFFAKQQIHKDNLLMEVSKRVLPSMITSYGKEYDDQDIEAGIIEDTIRISQKLIDEVYNYKRGKNETGT